MDVAKCKADPAASYLYDEFGVIIDVDRTNRTERILMSFASRADAGNEGAQKWLEDYFNEFFLVE